MVLTSQNRRQGWWIHKKGVFRYACVYLVQYREFSDELRVVSPERLEPLQRCRAAAHFVAGLAGAGQG